MSKIKLLKLKTTDKIKLILAIQTFEKIEAEVAKMVRFDNECENIKHWTLFALKQLRNGEEQKTNHSEV